MNILTRLLKVFINLRGSGSLVVYFNRGWPRTVNLRVDNGVHSNLEAVENLLSRHATSTPAKNRVSARLSDPIPPHVPNLEPRKDVHPPESLVPIPIPVYILSYVVGSYSSTRPIVAPSSRILFHSPITCHILGFAGYATTGVLEYSIHLPYCLLEAHRSGSLLDCD